jgi:hypothetical protein
MYEYGKETKKERKKLYIYNRKVKKEKNMRMKE